MKRSELKPYLRSAALILMMTTALSGCRVSDEFSGTPSDVSNVSDTQSVSVSGNFSVTENNSEITDVGSVGGDDPVYSTGSFISNESSVEVTSEIDISSISSSSISSNSGISSAASSSITVSSGGTASTSNVPNSSSIVSSSSPASVSSPQNSSVPASSKIPESSKITVSSSSSPQSGGFSFSWKNGNSWEENGKKCGTAELTITNNSGKSVSGWTASFAVPSGFSVTNGWSGEFSVNSTTATIKNAAFNGTIASGSSVTAGFNYSSPSAFTPPSNITFNGTVSTASSGNQGGNQGGNNNQGGNQGSSTQQTPNEPVSTDIKEMLTRTPNAKQGDDWLHVSGNKILDKDGKEVWLTGVNWFGYNTGTNIFDGLWNSNLRSSVKAIADHGFNLIRVPISAELLNQWSRGEYPRANYNNALNPELNALNSLQIFEYFLKLAEENGMKVMPDIHCAETDAQGHNVNLWYTGKVTVEDYYHALEWLADRYKNNDTIIAIDLKNEPHGKPNESNKAIWNGSADINNWKHTAEVAAQRVLAKNPNVLIMVEGTEIYSKNNGSYASTNSADYYFNWWGGNLRGVKDYPVNLGKYQDKLVYSPHDYGPTVFEQPWFKGGYNYESLIKDCWQDNWLYIHQTNTAPLLIGEWGGYMREPNLTWMTCMRRLIKENRLNHTFWCFNANSGDTGGLVLDDFVTWDTEKYNFVKEVLWQENGKFVGLDHQIPLGENGISVSKVK